MTRIGAQLLVVLALLVGLPIPAQAKGMELGGAVLRGPGLEHPLEMSREEFGMVRNENSPAAVAVEAVFAVNPDFPPPEELGPSYKLTYRMNIGFEPDVRKSSLQVDLYPYADGGPVAFVPQGQVMPMPIGGKSQEISSGWYEYPPAIIKNFRRNGLPAETAARRAETSLPTWAWLSAGLLLFGFGVWRRTLRHFSITTPSSATAQNCRL